MNAKEKDFVEQTRALITAGMVGPSRQDPDGLTAVIQQIAARPAGLFESASDRWHAERKAQQAAHAKQQAVVTRTQKREQAVSMLAADEAKRERLRAILDAADNKAYGLDGTPDSWGYEPDVSYEDDEPVYYQPDDDEPWAA